MTISYGIQGSTRPESTMADLPTETDALHEVRTTFSSTAKGVTSITRIVVPRGVLKASDGTLLARCTLDTLATFSNDIITGGFCLEAKDRLVDMVGRRRLISLSGDQLLRRAVSESRSGEDSTWNLPREEWESARSRLAAALAGTLDRRSGSSPSLTEQYIISNIEVTDLGNSAQSLAFAQSGSMKLAETYGQNMWKLRTQHVDIPIRSSICSSEKLKRRKRSTKCDLPYVQFPLSDVRNDTSEVSQKAVMGKTDEHAFGPGSLTPSTSWNCESLGSDAN